MIRGAILMWLTGEELKPFGSFLKHEVSEESVTDHNSLAREILQAKARE
jgi:hypothetical protein